MTRRRRSPRLVAVGLAAALLAAACGVPTSTGVRVDGPPEEPDAPGLSGAVPPPGPEEADTPEQLVEFFLRAAAADPENPVEVLRKFIHPDQRAGWEPPEDIYVARIDDDPPRTFGDPVKFDLTVQRIGQLGSDGVVEPLSYESQEISLHVRSDRAAGEEDVRPAGERYWIVDPPEDYLLLDDQALDSHFQARPIYFWDQQREKLVPDLRWLPESLNRAARSQAVLEWLLRDGPASWLESAVREVADVELQGNVVPGEGTLEVPLTAPSRDLDLDALITQLWWTLRPDLVDTGIDVTVVINDERIQLDGDYGAVNPIPEEVTASFAIVGGKIVPYLPNADPPEVLVEREDFNQGIERAALSRNGRLAAVVRQQADGRFRLDLAGPDGVTRTTLTAQAMGRPVWLNNPGGIGLVAADGALHSFAAGRSAVTKVEVPNLANITAVAAAPDGRRLALVAGGALHMAAMARTGEGSQQILRPPRRIPTSAANLDGVAFTREDWLAVIGAGEEERELYELTVDGALEQRLRGLGSSAISSIVAFPIHPVMEGTEDISIMYEADDRTYRYTRVDPVPVDADDLLDDPPEDVSPLAPFFLD